MSLEAGVSVSAGVSAPGFLGEGFSSGPSFTPESFSSSFSLPQIDSGGSFVGGLNAQNLFSETSLFSASSSSVPELPPRGASEIFSKPGGWQTIVKSEEKKADPLSIFSEIGFEPLIPKAGDIVKEGQALIKEGEWVTMAKNPGIEPLSKQSSVRVALESRTDEKQTADVSKAQAQGLSGGIAEQALQEEQALIWAEEVLRTDLHMAKAGEDLEQIRKTGEDPKEEPGAKEKADRQEVARIMLLLDRLVKQEKEDEEENDLEKNSIPLEKKSEKITRRLLSFGVDNAAQASRKSTLRAMIGELFTLARLTKTKKISGREVTAQIKEKKEHKSRLLAQSGLSNAPDGSFHEVIKDVGQLEARDTSLESEIFMKLRAGLIVDAKPAVRVVEDQTNDLVTEGDVKRVTKLVNSKSAAV